MRTQLLAGYGLTGKFTLNTGSSPDPRFEEVRVRAIGVAGANR
jgi:hypothetical protein